MAGGRRHSASVAVAGFGAHGCIASAPVEPLDMEGKKKKKIDLLRPLLLVVHY